MDINLLPHKLIKTNFNWMIRFILDTLNSRHLDYFLSYLCSLNGKEFCWKFLEVTSEMKFTAWSLLWHAVGVNLEEGKRRDVGTQEEEGLCWLLWISLLTVQLEGEWQFGASLRLKQGGWDIKHHRDLMLDVGHWGVTEFWEGNFPLPRESQK